MAEPRKDLTLLEKARYKRQVDKFDGDLRIELSVCPVRKIHGAHAAVTDQSIQLRRPESSLA
jgi:hypothetical protein